MLSAHLEAAIVADIERASGGAFALVSATGIAGGSINQAYCFESHQARYFVKVNQAEHAAMFEAEMIGLTALASSTALAIPRPLVRGMDGQHTWLVLQWLDLVRLDREAEIILGRGLAQLHRCTGQHFGFQRDNWLGLTSQPNPKAEHWVPFFRDCRLSHQLRIAAHKLGATSQLVNLAEQILNHIDVFFTGYTPVPSLLHGDLWGGNAAATSAGGAAIFDPAPYFGDRETDIAMTQLFGGFGADFYAAYREAWPLDRGFAIRRDLYNLYHVLNHCNLFSGSYCAQAVAIMRGLLAEV